MRAARPDPGPPPAPLTIADVKLADLTAFCRPGINSMVTLWTPSSPAVGASRQIPWLKFGVPTIRRQGRDDAQIVMIGARLGRNASDDEHDTAWAFQIEVVGFAFEFLDGAAYAHAWIRPDEGDSFRVPPSGWDPFADGKICKGTRATCKWGDGPHPITRYIPGANAPLFELIRGWRITMAWSHLGDEDGE